MIRTRQTTGTSPDPPADGDAIRLIDQAYSDDCLDRAAEAFERIRAGNHWRDWVDVANGLAELRDTALRTSHSNKPEGKDNTAIGQLFDQYKWPRKIDRATITHCYWVADHLDEIERWRGTLADNQRELWNHPSIVKRSYERSRVQPQGGHDQPKVSPYKQMQASLVEAQTERDHWKRLAEEGGSLFDLRRDTPKNIALAIVNNCTPWRVEQIIRECRAELKRQKEDMPDDRNLPALIDRARFRLAKARTSAEALEARAWPKAHCMSRSW